MLPLMFSHRYQAMIRHSHRWLLTAALFLILTACQSPLTTPTQPDNTAENIASEAEQSGDYPAAAQQYTELAKTSKGSQQAFLLSTCGICLFSNQSI